MLAVGRGRVYSCVRSLFSPDQLVETEFDTDSDFLLSFVTDTVSAQLRQAFEIELDCYIAYLSVVVGEA